MIFKKRLLFLVEENKSKREICGGENLMMKKDKFETEISQISETSALIEFGTEISEDINKKVRTFCTYIDEHPFNGMIEYVPAFASVSVVYNPLKYEQ